jgi:MFS family permease
MNERSSRSNRDASNQKIKISRNVIALGFVSLFTDAASEMIYPLVPILVTLLGSSALVLGVIEGVAETTAAMLKLVSGIISDRVGKRKILVIIGYGISTLIRPLTGAVTAAWQIVFVRMTDRVGKGVRTAPRDALIASSVDERIRGKAYGFHRAMDHTGAVVGPILAITVMAVLMLLFQVQAPLSILRWTFYLSIIPGLCALTALIAFVEDKTEPALKTGKFNFSLKQFDSNFIRYLGIVILFTLGNSSDAFLLLRIRDTFHHSQSLYSVMGAVPLIGNLISRFGDAETQEKLMDILFIPMVWGYFNVIKAAFSTHLGALSDRIGRKKVIHIGWGIYTVVYLAFALLDRLPEGSRIFATLVLFTVYALYYAACEGTEKAFVADLVRSEVRGSAFGLYNFAVGLGALPASVIFGLLYKTLGAPVAFGIGGLLAFGAMILLAVTVKEKSRSD